MPQIAISLWPLITSGVKMEIQKNAEQMPRLEPLDSA